VDARNAASEWWLGWHLNSVLLLSSAVHGTLLAVIYRTLIDPHGFDAAQLVTQPGTLLLALALRIYIGHARGVPMRFCRSPRDPTGPRMSRPTPMHQSKTGAPVMRMIAAVALATMLAAGPAAAQSFGVATFFATISKSGNTVLNSGVQASEQTGPGKYRVTFTRPITSCAFAARRAWRTGVGGPSGRQAHQRLDLLLGRHRRQPQLQPDRLLRAVIEAGRQMLPEHARRIDGLLGFIDSPRSLWTPH
jgi:hypothetical protein